MALSHTVKSVEQLQKQLKGSVLTPDHPDYDQIRRGWDLSIDHHPALIIVPTNAQDVVAGVQYAREAGLNIAVQSTGHGMQYPADDSLLIVTSRMSKVQVDVEARKAKVEAGAIWKNVLDAATPHGLAPLLGSSPHVGVVGYSLGGGIGWLARRYGLAADSVRAVDIVTADGVLRHASPTENSDLFWGLRGGGGNFGVVTALEIQLYPVATVYGGTLTYPGDSARDALRFFRDWIKTVPDELTSSIRIMKFPPLPQLPEAMRGKTVVMVQAAFAGDAAQGEAWIRPWLDWNQPTTNTFQEIPFSEIGTISNDPVDPAAGFGSNEMLDSLSDAAIDVIARYATDSASPFALNELRHAGGAISGVAADANAIGNRDVQLFFQIGGPVFSPEAHTAMLAYLPRYKEAMKPYLRGGVYLNFMKGREASARVKDAYRPESYERLLALKAKYDPDNLFRFSYQLVAT
jgi:FAD/FMN-containing dehydrogenase